MTPQIFPTLTQLFERLPSLSQREWIFVNLEVWNTSPADARFFYIPWSDVQDLADDEVFENEDGAELPVSVRDERLQEWMLVNALSQIRAMHEGTPSDDVLVADIDHYRQFDTFRRHPG